MTNASWPYVPGQCPSCYYFRAAEPAFVDDSRYQILGFCRHPRIAMELFRPQRLDVSGDECPLFIRVRDARHGRDRVR